MGDYLEIYAMADVADFTNAILCVANFYNDYGICPIKDAVSIPALSIRLCEKLVDNNVIFYLPNKGGGGQELLDTLKTGIIGILLLLLYSTPEFIVFRWSLLRMVTTTRSWSDKDS